LRQYFPHAELDADLGQQLVVIERLDQVIVGAVFVTAQPFLRRTAAADHYHLRKAPVGALLDLSAGLVAVNARHHHVQQHKVRVEAAQFLQALFPAARNVQLVLVAQQLLKDFDVDLVVVDYQYAMFHRNASWQNLLAGQLPVNRRRRSEIGKLTRSSRRGVSQAIAVAMNCQPKRQVGKTRC